MWTEKFYLRPWPHLVIDNFYDDETWAYICDKKSLFSKHKKSAIVRNYGISFSHIEDPVIKSYILEKLPIDFLVSKFPNHRDFSNLKLDLSLKILNLPKQFPMHDDSDGTQTFSLITYIEPEHSVGTILYDKDKNLNKVVTWKPNRAVIFASVPDISLHSAGNWEESDRYSVVNFWVGEQ